ncbi:hypothetical protein MNBD_PLANCTO02-2159 [hydrothermal vent metagenome]|uniref:Xylose isomerase-like TIM barrel domain-containing protein n=1 Tax=hydrothermal vent metagenome TaxID=652676 RepID=A0A3B1DZJ5_9ZZZZ
MSQNIERRDFLKKSTVAVASTVVAASLTNNSIAAEKKESAKLPQLKKAVKISMVKGKLSVLEKFQLLKEIGYDGVEINGPTKFDDKEVLAARDKTGLPIHGVVGGAHWRFTLSDPNPKVREKGLNIFMEGMKKAKIYGATSALLVPAVVKKNVSYADAYKRSQAEIKKALPLAEKLGIQILIENVWNNFLLSPLEEVRYIDEFKSEMVGAYFDVGNVIRFGWATHWIETLGHRIKKLDIKEYSRKKQKNEGIYKGFRVKLGEGDCDWPDVMTALVEIGYNGWGTAEVPGGDKKRLTEIYNNMNKIFSKATS